MIELVSYAIQIMYSDVQREVTTTITNRYHYETTNAILLRANKYDVYWFVYSAVHSLLRSLNKLHFRVWIKRTSQVIRSNWRLRCLQSTQSYQGEVHTLIFQHLDIKIFIRNSKSPHSYETYYLSKLL